MSRWPDVTCVFFDQQEYGEREAARVAQVDAYRARYPDLSYGDLWKTTGLTEAQREFFPLGSMWECPWYFDPHEEGAEARAKAAIASIQANPNGSHHLSIHYWTTWAAWRPPISVICPDGRGWDIDSKSSNGSGWTITGTAPLISASPSIWTRMSDPASYHGFLGSNGAPPGVFRAC